MHKIVFNLLRRKYFLPSVLISYLYLKNYYSLPGISCPFRAITGIPCPSCYLTRSTCMALQGDLENSFKMHFFGPFVALFFIIWSIRSIQTKKFFPFLITEKLLLILSISFLSYWIIRMFYGFPLS